MHKDVLLIALEAIDYVKDVVSTLRYEDIMKILNVTTECDGLFDFEFSNICGTVFEGEGEHYLQDSFDVWSKDFSELLYQRLTRAEILDLLRKM